MVCRFTIIITIFIIIISGRKRNEKDRFFENGQIVFGHFKNVHF
jgi:hypothetical protein